VAEGRSRVAASWRPAAREFDERQHFNEYRAATLRAYADDVPLAFDVDLWIRRSAGRRASSGGNAAAPRPPLFPNAGGRNRQRAFRDALADILPIEHGWAPTLRIAYFEVRPWIFEAEAEGRLDALVKDRIASASPGG
jgi:hypothetical protein